MKKLLLGTASLMAAVTAAMPAQAGDVSVSTSIDYVSEYVFRGVSFARGAVQPGISISKDNFTVGVWTSAAIGEASVVAGDEIDVYASYGFNVSDTISASVGATIYHFPDVPGSLFDFGGASTLEFNGGLSFNTPLSPSVTAYYDVDLEAFTLEGGVSHSVPVAEKTNLNLGLTAGQRLWDIVLRIKSPPISARIIRSPPSIRLISAALKTQQEHHFLPQQMIIFYGLVLAFPQVFKTYIKTVKGSASAEPFYV